MLLKICRQNYYYFFFCWKTLCFDVGNDYDLRVVYSHISLISQVLVKINDTPRNNYLNHQQSLWEQDRKKDQERNKITIHIICKRIIKTFALNKKDNMLSSTGVRIVPKVQKIVGLRFYIYIKHIYFIQVFKKMGSWWNELLGRICSQLDEDSLNHSVKPSCGRLFWVSLGTPVKTRCQSTSPCLRTKTIISQHEEWQSRSLSLDH